ncbi:MAG: GvpL/GvpF family gas vesicle protein [Acidobacteria bacterium]|nr:GvpL/GvpF family gas vesicle protein [Acidobacteriota bacterium]
MSTWYVYCLGDEVTNEMLGGARGLNDAPLGLVEHGGLAAVVSPFEAERVNVTPENALTHNRVNAALLTRSTPLPFRFGTLAGEARLAAFMESQGDALRATLGRVRGCVEMSVKIIWDVEAARREAAGPEPETPAEGGGGSGTAFLLSKRREILGGEALRIRAEAVAEWFDGRLSDVVRESRVTVNPAGALVVRAAHLVERGRIEEYRARVQALGEERAASLRFLKSGAWPPYSFSDLRP